MDKKENLKVSIIFSFISQLICYLSPLIVSPYISRVLGAAGIGEYSYAYSYVYYFSVAILFGFSSYGVKKIAEYREDKETYSSYFWTIFLERFIFFLVFLSIYFVLSFFNCFGNSINRSVLFALIIVLISNALDIGFLFQGLEKFKLISYGHMLANLLFIISVFLFVKSSDDLVIYTLLKSGVNLLLDIFLWIFAFRKLTRFHIIKGELKTVFVGSAKFFLPTILLSVGNQIDQTFIGMFCGNTEVGYYQQASKLPSLISSLTYAIAPVMLSRISFLYKENKLDEAKEKIGKAFNLALFVSIPCCVGMYLIGQFFIPAFFGEEYLPSINILYCLLPTSLLCPLSSILISAYYYPSKKTIFVTWFLLIDLVVDSSLTFILTRFTGLGGKGAAIGSLVAEVILLSLLLFCSNKIISFKVLLKDLWKVVVASLTMVAVVLFTNYFVSNLSNAIVTVIDVFLGAITYIAMSLLLKERMINQAFAFIKSKFKKSKEEVQK